MSEGGRAASPLATGDYGGHYQDAIGGWLLATMLVDGAIPGVPGEIVRVGFQRRTHGALLDDAVVTVRGGFEVEFSIKVAVSIAVRDADFRETLTMAWARMRADERSRAGLVAPPTASGVHVFKRLVSLAHGHDDVAEFMTLVSSPGIVKARDRKRLAACRTILNEINGWPLDDQQYHAFLRRFVVLELDFDVPPSGDLESLVTTLAACQDISADEARSLFPRLVEFGEEAAIAAAAIDRPGLIARLAARGIVAGTPADLRPALDAIAAYARRTFESRSDDVAGVHLDRSRVVQRVQDTISSGKDVLVSGPSGYGKSTVVRSLCEALSAGGPVLHLSGRRLEMVGSWAALTGDIGVSPDRARLADTLATNPAGVTIVFDAMEHVQSSGSRALVRDLLRDLSQRSDRVNVVLATRDALVAHVLAWLDMSVLRPLENIKVESVSDDEAVQIARASPVLGQLIARIGADRIPGGLMLLRLLHDARIPNETLAATSASEADLLDLWWRYVLVGNDPSRHDRLAIALAAAGAVVGSPPGVFRMPAGLNGAALAELERDGILLLDLDAADRYRFGHDVVQDWAVVRWLEYDPDVLAQRLDALSRTPGFYRCIVLLAQRLAEHDPRRFDELWIALKRGEDRRGEQAFLSALVLSTRAPDLLEAHSERLLESDGARLATLVTVIATEQVDIDVRQVDFVLRRGFDVGTATSFAAANGTPRFVLWAPLIRFCLAHVRELGRAYLPFLRLAEKWQKDASPAFPLREPILQAAMWVLQRVERWRPHQPGEDAIRIQYDDTGDAEKCARAIVAHSADVDAALVAGYLRELRLHGWGDAQDDMLGHLGIVGVTLTDEVVEYAFETLVETEPANSWERDRSQLGLRDFLYYPASDVQGPFLAMLRQNETAGLRLVRRLAARAAEHRERDVVREHGVHLRALSFEFRGRTIAMKGDERAYVWFRPGSHESNILTSALMAVETWAIEQVRNGRDVVDIAELLLSDTEAIAFLGIVVGLGYDFPDLVPELVDLVARPWLWRMEQTRQGMDNAPQDFDAILPAELRLPAYKPHIRDRNRERDAERAQPRLAMAFAVRYLFGGDDALEERFVRRVAEMGVVDACLWVEEAERVDEAEEARELFEQYRSMTNRDDYAGVGDRVQWRPPTALLPSESELRTHAVRQAMLSADLVGAAALRDYRAPPNPRGFELVGQATEAELVAGHFSGQDETYARHSVRRCAAVAVTFLPLFDETPSDWAVRVVRDAAVTEDARNWLPQADDEDAMDLRISLATATGALLAADGADDSLRRLVLRSAALAPPNVGASFLRGLIPAWASRPETPANVLFILLEAAWLDGSGPALSDAEVAVFVEADRERRVGPAPNVRPLSGIAAYRIARALNTMRLRFRNPTAVDMLVPLADQLMALVREHDEDDHFTLELSTNVACLCANLFAVLADGRHNDFREGVVEWRASLEFYASTVTAFVRGHLAYLEIPDEAVTRFFELARPFLGADHRTALGREHLERGFRDACWSLVMAEEFSGVVVAADWPHAARFADHIDRWVSVVGGHPTTASALVAFLDRFETALEPAWIVGWMNACIASTTPVLKDEFWRNNGANITALVLRMQSGRSRDFEDGMLRGATAFLADELVAAGIAGAGEIRRALEVRKIR